jgi:hypothetical protein
MPSSITPQDAASGLSMALARFTDVAEQAMRAVADDDLDGAALILGVSESRHAEINDAWNDLRTALDNAGADWQRARDRGSSA